MSESKHTPGPWSYLPRHIAESEPEVRAPAGWLICCTAGDEDARLIAAAPDLLAALRLLVDRNASISGDTIQLHLIGSHGEAIAALNRARAAIAKAEGRP